MGSLIHLTTGHPMPDHFIDLRATHNSHRWYLPVTPSVTVGPPGHSISQPLFGHQGKKAGVRAM